VIKSPKFVLQPPKLTQSMLPSVARLSPPIDVPKDNPSKISSRAEKGAHHSKVEELAGQCRGTSFAQRDIQTTPNSCDVGHVPIDMLPDELLLEIFYFMCVDGDYKNGCKPTWEMLVHVCRRWRSIVFAAPRRLDLQLVYMGGRPVDRMWDVWPALPIVIRAKSIGGQCGNNILAALKHNDRISQIYIDFILWSAPLLLEEAMQGPYPALTDLELLSFDGEALVFSNSFLGGSQAAPHLRSLRLHNIAFTALPKLLLSSTGLVCLSLWYIPPPGYFSAEAMVDCLSSMIDLEQLEIDFTCCRPGPRRRQSPITRTILPVLYSFSFRGSIEHLEDFYARIGAPLLKHIYLEYSDPAIFDISTISLSISSNLKELFKALNQAYMVLYGFTVDIILSSRNGTTGGRMLMLSFMCNGSGWRLRSLTQDCCPFSPRSRLANFDRLNDLPFKDQDPWGHIRTIGNARWLELLRYFASVENLYLSEGLAILVVPAMQELAAREGVATRVLLALQNLFIEGHWFSKTPREKAFEFEEFVAARKLSGYPVSLQRWV